MLKEAFLYFFNLFLLHLPIVSFSHPFYSTISTSAKSNNDFHNLEFSTLSACSHLRDISSDFDAIIVSLWNISFVESISRYSSSGDVPKGILIFFSKNKLCYQLDERYAQFAFLLIYPLPILLASKVTLFLFQTTHYCETLVKNRRKKFLVTNLASIFRTNRRRSRPYLYILHSGHGCISKGLSNLQPFKAISSYSGLRFY